MSRARSTFTPLLLLATSACSAIVTMSGPASGFTPFVPRPVAGTALFDWKGILHCHSYLSHDSKGKVEDIAAACASVGIDFLVMTDHQTPYSIARGARGVIAKTLFVVGAELRTPDGVLLAFPLRKFVSPKPTTQEVVDEVHAQDALALVGHAEYFEPWGTRGLDGCEVVNLHAAARAADKPALLVSGIFAGPRTLFEVLCKRPDAVLARYDEQLRTRRPFPLVAGNDAHENIKLFGPLGGTIGTYEELFKVVTTHVLAPTLDEAALVAAFRAGRTYLSFDLFGDTTGFRFTAEGGGSVATLGDRVPTHDRLKLVVEVPRRSRIEVFRDGMLAQAVVGTRLEVAHPEPGVWRAEVRLEDGRPWVLASPLWITSPHEE